MSAKRPNGVTRQAVLDFLVRDADLDGIVTTTATELSHALGVTHPAILSQFKHLVDEGTLTPLSKGRRGVVTYQLAEQVMA